MSAISYAFCEILWASSRTPWHIRRLGEKGLRLSGGVDTRALCGRKVAWDLAVELTEHHLYENCCEACVVEYRAKGGGSELSASSQQDAKTAGISNSAPKAKS